MYRQLKIFTQGKHEITSLVADFPFDETTTSLSQPLSFSMTIDDGVVVFQYDEPNQPFHLMVGMESKLVVMKMQENASKRDRDVFEKTTKKNFTLRNMDTKRVSTLKSLTPKRISEEDPETTQTVHSDK